MANVKISQLTAKAAKVESTDRIPIADFNGSTYDSKYVTGAEINEVLLDSTPQLGGNLDVNGHTITSASNGNIQIRPNGTGAVLVGDLSGSAAASLRFMELSDNGSNYVALKSANDLTGSTTYTLPIADGTNGQVLQTNGSGTLTWQGIVYTIELIDALTVDFYASYNLKINSVSNVLNSPTTTILDDGVSYTVGGGATIASGSKVTVTVSTAAVVNLNIEKA